jgi:uncharacterized membrane protein
VNLEDYRMVFFVVILGLILVAVYPAFSLIVPSQGGSEKFSELWLLGSGHMTENYPFNVGAGEEYRVFVGVSNHMGVSEYYRIYVKIRNQTQSLPDVDSFEPSSLQPLQEHQFFLADGETWESPITFAFQDVSFKNNSVSIGEVAINGKTFVLDAFSLWDSEKMGFYFQLFFELWRYDMEILNFLSTIYRSSEFNCFL